MESLDGSSNLLLRIQEGDMINGLAVVGEGRKGCEKGWGVNA
jgi:hypothetical protein